MKFLSVFLASAVSLVNAAAVPASPLKVELSRMSNTGVKITVTNQGSTDLHLFNKGNILDTAPTEKFTVTTSGNTMPFEGIKIRPFLGAIAKGSITTIAAGEKFETTVDIASTYQLSTNGKVEVVTSGSIPAIDADSNKISSSVSFQSNALTLQVDGKEAAQVHSALDQLQFRTDVQPDCQGNNLTETIVALRNCVSLALKAADAARKGPAAKLTEYFRNSKKATRNKVAARYAAIADECSTKMSGKTDEYCSDKYKSCDENVLAYAVPTASIVVNCPAYFSSLSSLSKSCHAQDQATTTIHEFSHLPEVYSPGTQDYAYGYTALTKLPAAKAILNADTYAYFANAIYAKC